MKYVLEKIKNEGMLRGLGGDIIENVDGSDFFLLIIFPATKFIKICGIKIDNSTKWYNSQL